jgi:hypothetical protein
MTTVPIVFGSKPLSCVIFAENVGDGLPCQATKPGIIRKNQVFAGFLWSPELSVLAIFAAAFVAWPARRNAVSK